MEVGEWLNILQMKGYYVGRYAARTLMRKAGIEESVN
jgi:hypothetical protein